MFYYALKVLVTAAIVVTVSEIAKRSTGFAALIASLPLTSLLAFIWLRLESSSTAQIAQLSSQIFWLVLPSLVLFVLFPWLLKLGVNFWISLGLSIAATSVCYAALVLLLRRLGVGIGF